MLNAVIHTEDANDCITEYNFICRHDTKCTSVKVYRKLGKPVSFSAHVQALVALEYGRVNIDQSARDQMNVCASIRSQKQIDCMRSMI